MKQDLHILLIEDSPDDAELICEYLSEFPEMICHVVARLEDARNEVERRAFDVVLIDLTLPDSTGLTTLSTLLESAPSLPAIVMTQINDDHTALAAMRLGAQDYLVKGRFDDEVLVRAIQYAIQRKEILLERARYQVELEDMVRTRTARLNESNLQLSKEEEGHRTAERARQRLAIAIDATIDGVVLVTPAGTIEYVNSGFATITGYTVVEAVGSDVNILQSEHFGKAIFVCVFKPLRAGQSWSETLSCRRKNGNRYEAEITVTPVLEAGDTPTGYVCVLRDVTEYRQLQKQVQVSQRLEAVGQLAGGVAHDFNNILQVILSLTSIGRTDARDTPEIAEHFRGIEEAGKRAATLTHQLLAFGRKQMFNSKVVNLNKAIVDLNKMLCRLIGINISIETYLADDLPEIEADLTQIDQVVMNLCINARDAMPRGGRICIKTTSVALDYSYCTAYPWASPGDYVMLEVSDTGHGIRAEDQARIFEPFFTTKSEGKGTGLGLATVYGIVKQHGGFIHCYSDHGVGTSFRLYFPVSEGEIVVMTDKLEDRIMLRGVETVLLVEDNHQVLEFTRRFLSHAGYHVVTAKDGLEAKELLAKGIHDYDIVVSDVMMPRCGGLALYDFLRDSGAPIPVLLTTGYSAELYETDRVKRDSINLLEKPYSREQLLSTVREILDKRKTPADGAGAGCKV